MNGSDTEYRYYNVCADEMEMVVDTEFVTTTEGQRRRCVQIALVPYANVHVTSRRRHTVFMWRTVGGTTNE